ncbi:D-alanyl-D-alanine carboxypeptidase [Streptomyces malaysiense]|uniref:serine-type D-Ala-D-Ala carboxypeptidase n=1 Tax=Streptomyces malaysiense TaxID=1428626 RepID=A0A1J4PWI7_9ACTN|nr:D-alanyl-D-alanine carboxypeptidase [Streptomyces malaysiense]
MAGESPDRSKQRESSAGATSGNAGSVPEARDPRLAVARGGSGGSTGAGQKDSSNGGTDTATKVFRTPAVEEDTALRHAVSAWVRDADGPKTSTDASAKDAEGSAAGVAEDAPDAGDEGDANTKAATGAISTGAASGSDAEEADATDTGSGADAKAAAEGNGAEPDAGSGAEDAPGAQDDGADGDGTPAGDADAGAATDAAGDPEPGASVTDGSDTEAGAEAEAEDPADGAAGKADAGAKAGARPKTPADAGTKDGAEAKAGTAAEADAGAAGKAPGEPADTDGGAKDPQDPSAADGESRTDGADEKTDGESEAGAGTAGAGTVDRPTAVFKAVRPKDQVDQPTTMLKVGKGAKQDEPDAERTSTFVALKDDVRHKPKSAPAEETTAVPQVGPERTTQQPLPPRPPLDLLAELTNTPPPPETPTRTLLRRVKIWTPLVILLVIVFAVVQTLRPLPSPTLALTAKDSYTFDGGQVNLPWPSEGQGWMDGDGIGTMGNFGKQTPVAIGSVAKTMTAYIILRDHPLKPGQEGPKIKVDALAEKEGGYSKSGESTLNTIHAGDSLTEKQALSAVMIPSANNIARLLARWDAGSEAAFVKKMNATAKELGMTGTTYTDPSGLKETTVSTAEDQVKIGRAVVKIPALVAITSAASWTDPTGHNWPNYNSLPYWIGAIGLKTGTTTAAGGNLLFAARKKVGGQTVTVVGAILGQHKGPSILDTANNVSKTALLGAEQALTSAKILKKGDVVGYVDDQLGGRTPIVVTQDVTAVGWSGLKVKLSFTSDTVPHTAKAGTRVGTLTVGDGTTAAIKVPVALQQDLAKPGFGAKLTRVG